MKRSSGKIYFIQLMIQRQSLMLVVYNYICKLLVLPLLSPPDMVICFKKWKIQGPEKEFLTQTFLEMTL